MDNWPDVACEQPPRLEKNEVAEWGLWRVDMAETVDIDYMPPFQGSRCALNSSASSYWPEYWSLTVSIVISILLTALSNLHTKFVIMWPLSSECFNNLFKKAVSDWLRDFVHITQVKVVQKRCLRHLAEKLWGDRHTRILHLHSWTRTFAITFTLSTYFASNLFLSGTICCVIWRTLRPQECAEVI